MGRGESERELSLTVRVRPRKWYGELFLTEDEFIPTVSPAPLPTRNIGSEGISSRNLFRHNPRFIVEIGSDSLPWETMGEGNDPSGDPGPVGDSGGIPA